MGTYLDGLAEVTASRGFTPQNSLAVVSACRDELCQPVVAEITSRWGMPFNASGLGGMPALGPTGWGACLSNAPQGDGRHRLLVLAFPHVGIGPEGISGMALHADQAKPRPCCGALNAVRKSLVGALDSSAVDPEDHEVNRLTRILSTDLATTPTDLVEMAFAASISIERVIWGELGATEEFYDADVAVFTAIQIHTGSGVDYALGRTRHIKDAASSEPIQI